MFSPILASASWRYRTNAKQNRGHQVGSWTGRFGGHCAQASWSLGWGWTWSKAADPESTLYNTWLRVLTAGEQLLTKVCNLRFGTVNTHVILDGLDYNALETICCCSVTKSCLTLVTPWTAVHQAPLSVGFPRQEYWSQLPFLSPGDFPDPGIKPTSP